VADLTIDELARTVGMTVRNVRSHQTRGLLPGPEVRGRVGYYGDEHVARLRLIQELQDEGMPLRLVERLLRRDADTADRLLALRRTVLAEYAAPTTMTTSVDELQARFGEFHEEHLQQALALGAVQPRSDGTIGVPNPALLDIAEQVVRDGIPLGVAIDVAAQVQTACGDLARTFVDMVRDQVWSPFDAAGRPEAQWPQIAQTIDQIRPMAGEVLAAILPGAIAQEIERVFGEELRNKAQAQ